MKALDRLLPRRFNAMVAVCASALIAGLALVPPASADGFQFVRTSSGQVRCGVGPLKSPVNAQPGKDSSTLPHRGGQQAGTGIWPSLIAVEAFVGMLGISAAPI
jgi:hypothetical protein